jgi:hypothetical protein
MSRRQALGALTVVNDEDDSSAAALAAEAKARLVARHSVDGAHQRGVISVQCRDQIADT